MSPHTQSTWVDKERKEIYSIIVKMKSKQVIVLVKIFEIWCWHGAEELYLNMQRTHAMHRGSHTLNIITVWFKKLLNKKEYYIM